MPGDTRHVILLPSLPTILVTSMEVPIGLRSRMKDSQRPERSDDEKLRNYETVSVRVWAFLFKLLSMKQRKGSQLVVLLCLGTSSGHINLKLAYKILILMSA